MNKKIKIAVIGDFNYTYNTHHATNLAIGHASDFLEIDCDFYWIKALQFSELKQVELKKYDAFWVSPGPYKDNSSVDVVIQELINQQKPVLITGEAFANFIEVIASVHQMNPLEMKIISENLVKNNHFERIEIVPNSFQLREIYKRHSRTELTANRYSLYPKFLNKLNDSVLDIEAYNQFNDPEIVSLKNKNFFVASACCPQISSMRDIPHPLIYTFLKATFLD
ncbi:MAG TPA: hypothetical protein PLP27_06965 [Crocinitomicaceae bacterium]|nr:hypothetical protein [Crocinitomicaceae bacterium]